ncbi:hypothetical protein [Bacillus sp. 445_BSPC]|uniref:hypothetical protein n=1 Tax=Bacillus sp. 445_BSPC TaxID=1581712 RepID=UPI0006621E4B|nr:hypothetical protein [Bacillus sp. 445_BSPC]
MKQTKPHTVRLTDKEYTLIKSMRQLTEDSSAYINSLCYSDPILSFISGLQGNELIKSIRGTNDKSAIYLNIALQNTRESDLLKKFGSYASSILHFGMEVPFNTSYLIYREFYFSVDLETTIQEFKTYLTSTYSDLEEGYLKEKEQMEQNALIPLVIQPKYINAFKDLVNTTIEIQQDMKKEFDGTVFNETLLNIEYLKSLEKQLMNNKNEITLSIHVLYEDLVSHVFENSDLFLFDNDEQSFALIQELRILWNEQIKNHSEVIHYFNHQSYLEDRLESMRKALYK